MQMRILVSGGPGAGSTSTAERLGGELGIPVFDSDAFFHKPTDPPFQEQYDPDERRRLLSEALSAAPSWILSGSVARWGCELGHVHLGVFLGVPKEERMRRLILRERERFGPRIEIGGDLHEGNGEFLKWAATYEVGTGVGRNWETDREFLFRKCERSHEVTMSLKIEQVVSEILRQLNFFDE